VHSNTLYTEKHFNNTHVELISPLYKLQDKYFGTFRVNRAAQ